MRPFDGLYKGYRYQCVVYTFAIVKNIGYKTDSAWSGIAFHPVSSYIGPPSMIAGRIDFSIAFPIALWGSKTAWEHGINVTVEREPGCHDLLSEAVAPFDIPPQRAPEHRPDKNDALI